MYRITLMQGVSNRTANAFDVVYTFAAAPPLTWPVFPTGDYKNQAVIEVNCPLRNLLDRAGVTSSVLRAHYPQAPTTIEYVISSVQP